MMEQTTARLRKTFHYPTDDDDDDLLPEAFDEEGISLYITPHSCSLLQIPKPPILFTTYSSLTLPPHRARIPNPLTCPRKRNPQCPIRKDPPLTPTPQRRSLHCHALYGPNRFPLSPEHHFSPLYRLPPTFPPPGGYCYPISGRLECKCGCG